MSVTELKKKLHTAVDGIEDVQLLQTLFDMTKLPFRMDNEPFTEEELKMLNERREEYLRGAAEVIPWRESIAKSREKHGL